MSTSKLPNHRPQLVVELGFAANDLRALGYTAMAMICVDAANALREIQQSNRECDCGHSTGKPRPHGHLRDCPAVQAQPEDAFAPMLPHLTAYEVLLAKGKAVEESGGWHDQQAFAEWNRLVTETHRALCHALAQIVGERVMNAVLCMDGNGWQFEPTVQAEREPEAEYVDTEFSPRKPHDYTPPKVCVPIDEAAKHVKITDEMVERATRAYFGPPPANISHPRDWMRKALEAALND